MNKKNRRVSGKKKKKKTRCQKPKAEKECANNNNDNNDGEQKHCGQSGDEEMKDERREKMGLGTKEEVSRKIFSWRGHYLYAWAGRKDSGGKGKGEKKNVKFYNLLAFVFFYFLCSQI
jgi:hypothetical protein